MAVYTDAIQKLYVAYFNRPADYEGLNNWERVITAAKGDTSAVAAAFADSKEYKDTYAGMSNMQIVAAVYKNLFNESNPDLKGLEFWTNALNTKAMSITDVVTKIAAGAQGAHAETYAAKVAAATAFTAALDTSAEVLGYTGEAANKVAKVWLSGVNKANLDASIAPAAINATISGVINPPVPGQTFFTTKGLDTITGTAGDDIINVVAFNSATGAVDTTLQSVDTIDGGAGNDTLNLEVAVGNNTGLTGTISGVENININEAAATLAANLNAGFFSGAKVVTQIGGAVNVTGLAAGVTAGFKNVTLAGDFDAATLGVQNAKVTAGSTAASANIALTSVKGDGANVAALDVAGSSLNTVTVTGTLAKNTGVAATPKLALNVTAGADAAGKSVASVAVNTAVKTDLTVAQKAGSTGGIATVDLSGSTGAVKFIGAPNTVATIKGGAAGDTLNLNTNFTATVTSATIDGGAGDDTITVNVGGGAGTFTANGGDGDDTIVVTQAQLVAGNVVNGGAGDDTLAFSNPAGFAAGDYVLLSSVVSGVETLELVNGVTALDGSKVAQFSTLVFDMASSGVTKVSQAVYTSADLTASAAGYTATTSASGTVTYGGTLDVTVLADATTQRLSGDAAIVTLDTANTEANLGATIAGDLSSSLTVKLLNSTDDTPATADYLATTTIAVDATKAAGTNNPVNLGSLKSLVLTGEGSAVVTSSGSVKLATIDASGLGGTLKATGVAGNITGGLTFTGNAAVAETITLGSGHDVLTIASTYSTMDTINGFDAKKDTTDATSTVDNLTFGGVTLGTGATIAKVALTSAESTLDLAFIKAAAASDAAGDAVVFFQFGGNTYLFKNVDVAGAGTGVLDSTDLAVKLVGTYDLTKDFSLSTSPAV